MRKLIVVLLICMNFVTISAGQNTPTYKIISNSNTEKDIEEMYQTKDDLLKDYVSWVKSVDDAYQVLADHTKAYDATFYNGEYIITLGEGKGKEITGKLKTSYCTSEKEIEKKSFFGSLFS